MSYNIEVSNGEGGAEFPIAYWLAAKLSPADTFDASYLRYIHFGCCILFLAIVNAVCIALTESLVFGFFVAFLPFFSTIFSFYSNTFMPDVPAVCLVMSGLGLLYFYYKSRNNWLLLFSIVLVALGGSIKVTAFSLYFAILFIGFVENVFSIKAFEKKLFPTFIELFMFGLPTIIVALWIIYIKHYNATYHSTYFRTDPYPIWALNKEQLQGFVWAITDRWNGKFLSIATTKVMLFIIPLSIFLAFRKNRMLGLAVLLFLLSQLAVMFFFAGLYIVHDYYSIMLVFTPAIAFLIVFYFLKQNMLLKFLLTLIFIPYIISEINYTRKELSTRYAENWNDEIYLSLAKCEPLLDDNGLLKNDKILVLGDPSSCISLYALQRKGWTNMMCCENYNGNNNEKRFQFMREHGLKWLVFLPNTKKLYPELSTIPYKKQFKINDCEFAEL